jgi:hypothetical protein
MQPDMIKPGIVYRAKNPCGLKKKNFLPVFWQHSFKARVTAGLFTEGSTNASSLKSRSI